MKKNIFWRRMELGIALGLFVLSVFSYVISFHNLDLTFNMLLITNDINKNLGTNYDFRNGEDFYKVNKSINYLDGYIISWNYLHYSFLGIFIAGLLLSDSLAHLSILTLKPKHEY